VQIPGLVPLYEELEAARFSQYAYREWLDLRPEERALASSVDAYIERRTEEAAVIRRETEARFPSHGLRERLIARRKKNAQAGD